MHRTVRLGVLLLLTASGAGALLGLLAAGGSLPLVGDAAAGGGRAAGHAGQARTVLPDGRWLLTGGEGPEGPQATVAITDPLSEGTLVVGRLAEVRAWHTATLLPDGSVLVFGGIGAAGQALATAERFDPATRTRAGVSVETGPRALHTATLLTDGRVLVVGGMSPEGVPLATLELWDVRTGTAVPVPAALETPRSGQRALLLANGVVALWGGFDHQGRALDNAEFFDPATLEVTADGVFTPPVDAGAPEVVASIPDDGATGVALDALLALRFSRALHVESVNGNTVQLAGPEGPVDATIVPAEGGMLAFVTPSTPLRSGVTYALTTNGALAEDGLPLPLTRVRFTTMGADAKEGNADTRPSATAEPRAGVSQPPDSEDEGWRRDPTQPESWRTGRPPSRWQSLPPLQAARGVTALAGQVLRLNGEPLPRVRLRIDDASARTDATGRFLLSGLKPGHAQLWIDGGRTHGLFEVGVDLTGGRTTALPYTIWLPKIDLAHEVTIPSPTREETVITTPEIPGLEVRIPAGTVIRDRDGQVVERLSITAVPVDRPPFPLPPGERVPLYFTVQPGGSYVDSAWHEGARLVYPNRANELAGTRFAFWNYDADERGWYVYGHGTVAPDRVHVVPDPGVSIYEFTGAMVIGAGNAPAGGPPGGCGGGCCDPGFGPADAGGSGGCGGGGGDGSYDGEPVSLATGLFVMRNTDLVLPDVIPIRLVRTYRENDGRVHAFGLSTTHPYDMYLVGDTFPYTFVELILPDGGRIHYDRTSSGTSYDDAVYEHVSTPTLFYKSHVSWNGTASPGRPVGGYDLTLKDGTVYEFPEAFLQSRSQKAALVSLRDRFGHRVTLTRDPSTGNLLRITSPHGRWIAFSYQGDLIQSATDNAGRQVTYTYDQYNRLTQVQDANVPPGVTTYTYEGTSDRIQTLSDPRRNATCAPPCSQPPTLAMVYNPDATVKMQTLADGTSTYNFTYQMMNRCQFGQNPGVTCASGADCLAGGVCVGVSTQTTVTDPRTSQHVVTFNTYGYSLTDARGSGARTVTYARSAGSNFAASVTEPLTGSRCRQRTMTYDPSGNVQTVSAASGPCGGTYASLTQTTYTYENRFNQVASIQTPAGTTVFTYDPSDPLVRLVNIRDGAGYVFPMAIDGGGRVASVSDPQGHATTFTYEGADLVAITDATNKTTRRFVDAAGRVRGITDPLGQMTRYDYDNLDHLTQVTDPLGGGIAFRYDGNGNLDTVTDSRHSPSAAVTQHHYNALNQLDRRTDPLNRVETFGYDGLGNLLTSTDRRSVTSDFVYDALHRRTCAGFGRTAGAQPNCRSGGPYSSVVTDAYDSGDRLTQATDSLAGLIARGYDDLDNLTSDASPQGSISYTYDAASRRQTMTIPGQNTLAYCYDGANRLTKIVQGTTCGAAPTLVSIGYDPAGRRSAVTLPNQVTMAYGYDAASRVGSLQYTLAGGVVHGLTYTYDAAGNRIAQGGDWARTGLPPAMSSASYDGADELKAWNGTAFPSSPSSPLDGNGNLTNDGTNTYTWNARNQLVGIGGSASASFVYDALGRRVRKTLGATTTQFLYDGLNPVQERDGTGAVTATLLGGLGIDEFLARTTGSGGSAVQRDFLPDALGSTVASTDQSGALQTQYTYEPFGQETLVAGSPGDSNPYQFTGRENDGTGLYYYRARYYSPTWQRFVSEDPIELGGFVSAFGRVPTWASGLYGLPDANLYPYAFDNPLNLLDPFGLSACSCNGPSSPFECEKQLALNLAYCVAQDVACRRAALLICIGPPVYRIPCLFTLNTFCNRLKSNCVKASWQVYAACSTGICR